MPTRYLKPGICDSETIDRCSPMAECLFYRLLVNVDDFGRIDARPAVVRSRCFPLKDTITNKDVTELLSELHNVGLIHLYNSDGCAYLQMKKWDNAPRASKSKCPPPTDDYIQLHTTVCKSPTVLPVTVTVTETKTGTGNRKPEPETGTATRSPRKQRVATGSDENDLLQSACKATWREYGSAYFARYGTEPVRNAKVNGQVKSFVKRLGYEESPPVAAFFLQSNLAYYVQRGHVFDCLLADAEKLRTEWATGRTMTATRARQIDQTQSNASAVDEALALMNGGSHAETA